MTDEILAKLRRIQHEAEGLQDLFDKLRAHAPAGADGLDSTRSVHVLIGDDGLPKQIQVVSGWRSQLAPTRVGPAVLEAFMAAVVAGMQAWSHALNQMRWPRRIAELEALAAQPRTEHELNLPSSDTVGFETTRELHEVTEAVLRAADQLRRSDPGREAVAVDGTDRSRNVSITLTHGGLRACSVQAAWASQQDGDAVTTALNTALHAARAQLDTHAKQPGPDAFSQLAGEALAALQRLARPTGRDE